MPNVDQPSSTERQRERERGTIGRLGDFDAEYFRSLEGQNGWIALGQENCRNQRYFTVHGANGERLGIVGVYDTDDDQNLAHVVVDPRFRGQGLAEGEISSRAVPEGAVMVWITNLRRSALWRTLRMRGSDSNELVRGARRRSVSSDAQCTIFRTDHSMLAARGYACVTRATR